MRTAFVGCMVMNREISHLVSESQNPIRTWWLRQGLHDTPDILRHELQRIIDEIERENEMLRENQRFEVICLGYSLCSNGVVGLRPRPLPLVIPRCDDCISLFLGSALLTTTMTEVREVVEAVKASELNGKVKIMIGGAPITQAFCDSIGADCYTPDAASAADAALAICAS